MAVVAGETVAPFVRPIISITTVRNRQETGKRNDKQEEKTKICRQQSKIHYKQHR